MAACGAGVASPHEANNMSAFRDDKRVLSHLHRKLGNAIQAHVVWVIWRWRPYARATRDNQTWVVKTDKELQDEGVTYSQRAIRDAIAHLDKAGVITRTRGPHPNRRLPNARFLRIDDGLFDELEQVASERKAAGVQRRVDAEADAGSSRLEMPHQPGDSRRFHKQETSNKTDRTTYKAKEKRARARRSDTKVIVTAEEARIQAGFEKGCRDRSPPYRAAALDHASPLEGIRRFWRAMKSTGIVSTEDAVEIARYFAKTYDADYAASLLGKRTGQVSPQPDQMLLGMFALDALSRWEQHRSLKSTFKKMPTFGEDEDEGP